MRPDKTQSGLPVLGKACARGQCHLTVLLVGGDARMPPRRSALPAVVRAVIACAVVAMGLLTPSPAAASRPLTLGFSDSIYVDPDPSVRDFWLDRTVASGGRTVVLLVRWRSIAPATRPPGFAPANPADPAYTWEGLDAAVRHASARGMRVLLTPLSAPDWAEGGGRDPKAVAGSWKPRPGMFADFMTAAARRYSGAFDPDGLVGRQPALPRVRHWQMWLEPNLEPHLSPQWERRRGRFRLASSDHYKKLLNAGYRAVNRVRKSNFVITAGTAPFGDYVVNGNRTPPAAFVRDMLCLKRSLRPQRRCRRAHFDALAHHPYSVGSPRRRAVNRDDVSVPDLHKLSRPLRVAQRRGLVRPPGRKQLWVTEFSYDSRPPDPNGVPARRHARWLAESFYLMWKQRVRTIAWFRIRDQEIGAGYPFTFQSGVYFRDGRAKIAQRAYRFPFVTERAGSRKVRFWGKAPRDGKVRIQRRTGGGWRTIARDRTGTSSIFSGRARLRGRAALRAVIGREASLRWLQR